jgi:hypothetical protein
MNTGAQTGKGSICPLGYYCPAGSPAPEPCPLGHYSNVTGMETCTPCPAGYYCDLGKSHYLMNKIAKESWRFIILF